MEHLSQKQVSGLVALSVLYWGAAAAKVRYGGHIFYANDLNRLGSFLATVPIGYIGIRVAEKLLSISPRERLVTTSLLAAPALLLDGAALMFFPTVYENPSLTGKNDPLAVSTSRMGAAWILFGVGASLGVALLIR